KPGREVDIGLGAYYNFGVVGPLTELAPLLSFLGSDRARDRGTNANPAGTGYDRVQIAPGIETTLKNVRIYADVELPIFRNMNGYQLTAPFATKLNGQTFDLSAQRGKVVIVSFWATWCPPCREEMPALDAFYRRYHGNGLEMIGLSADRPHDRSDAIKVMQSYTYPAAMLDDASVNDFGTPSSLPMTVIVDSNGVVRAKLT